MKEKTKQKGFIQIPLLIGILVAVIITSGIGIGAILHRQDNSETYKEPQDLIIEEELIESQAEKELEDTSEEKMITPSEIIEKDTTNNSQVAGIMDFDYSENEEAERIKREVERIKEEIEKIKTEEETLKLVEKLQPKEITEQQELEEQEYTKNNFPEIKTLINSFWSNPTIENFEEFCKKSKNVLTPEIKNVLSDDRTQMIDINKTFYELFRPCQVYLEKQKYWGFIRSSLNHKISFRDSDTDKNRELKIKYNQRIEEIAENYNFFGFMFAHSFLFISWTNYSEDPVSHFNSCLTYKPGYFSSTPNCNVFISKLIVPEEQLEQLQKNYEWAQ